MTNEAIERMSRVLMEVEFKLPGAGGLRGKLKLSAHQAREIARTALDAARVIPDICYDAYRCDKQWADLNSAEVFNLWIDAALREQK